MKKVGILTKTWECDGHKMVGIAPVDIGHPLTVTAAEMLAAGWMESDQSFERGYLSRRTKVENQPVLLAGRGTRNNMPYFLKPTWATNRFCVRQYLSPPIDKETGMRLEVRVFAG